jgi:thioredoxin
MKWAVLSLFMSMLILSCNTKKESKSSTNQVNKMGTIELTKAEFLAKVMNYEKNPQEWVFEGNKPCVIDFYANWCGPCKMLAPIMEELAESPEYAGKVDFYKVNTEDEPDLAALFGIQSIPSILFCPMHEKPQMTHGALPKETLKQAINEILLQTVPAK